LHCTLNVSYTPRPTGLWQCERGLKTYQEQTPNTVIARLGSKTKTETKDPMKPQYQDQDQ